MVNGKKKLKIIKYQKKQYTEKKMFALTTVYFSFQFEVNFKVFIDNMSWL